MFLSKKHEQNQQASQLSSSSSSSSNQQQQQHQLHQHLHQQHKQFMQKTDLKVKYYSNQNINNNASLSQPAPAPAPPSSANKPTNLSPANNSTSFNQTAATALNNLSYQANSTHGKQEASAIQLKRKIENSHTNLNKIGGSGCSGGVGAGESHQLQQREKKMNAGGVGGIGPDPKSSASSSSSTSSNVAANDEYSCIYYSSSSPAAAMGAVAATVNALNNLNSTTATSDNTMASAASCTSSNANITICANTSLQVVEQAESQDFSTQKFDNDDLVTLNNLNETIVLEELKERFSKNQIYTYIGDILIAMNPLKAISIYGKRVSNLYLKCENLRADLPPHVYATAEQCYREMMRTQQSQCILISGESGSGKTETCKYLVQHLLNRTKPFEFYLNAKIQEVNPLLEAFGNAKTRINDNSSRFGKYLEIYFEQDGTVVGAKFKEYLLEKSRVVYQNEYESTFHIFYLLFSGLNAEEKGKYHLKLHKKYRFMSNTTIDNCMTPENQEKFRGIRQSMNTIGFSQEDVESLLKILASVLLIGEIQFTPKKGNNNDAVQVKNMDVIKRVCELLEMDPTELNEALVSDVQITRGEQIKRERNMVQACDVRDALAKAFYGRLFSWIVNQINHHIQPVEGVTTSYSIGLLDIFGFENFEKNSFEQMCINLANEQLHQLFTKYIFKLEIQECLDEQVELNSSDLITYQDNQIILDLFQERMGLFALLDEESRFPKATDQSLAIKLHQSLSPAYSNVYIAPKNVGTSFHIVHYAGQVLYSVEGFLEKNRDFLPNNLFYAAQHSNNQLVQELFQCKLTRKGTIAPSDRQSKLRKSMTNTFDPLTNDADPFDSMVVTSPSSSDLHNGNGHGQQELNNLNGGGRSRIATSSVSSIHNTHASNNFVMNNFNAGGSNSRNTAAATAAGNRNGGKVGFHGMASNSSAAIDQADHDHRNSITSHALNLYASDKALPLTVACHFKNSLHELIEKINKCKAYFIRCIKPNMNQENTFINEFVVKQLRYCSLMHVCKIRKCGFPYRIKFAEFLKWYRAIQVCVLDKSETLAARQQRDVNNNLDDALQKCIKCLEYANVRDYKVGKSKLFLRYYHIDMLNSVAKKLENSVLVAQKITRGWLARKRIKTMRAAANNFFSQINDLANYVSAKMITQKNYQISVDQLKRHNKDGGQDKENEPNSHKNLLKKNNSKLSNGDLQLSPLKTPLKNLNASNWPDINEINSTLEEFDSMLNEYEMDIEQKENQHQYSPQPISHLLNINSSNPISRSATSFNNKISPTSVLYLVNNNNNKNDNTLKKRNALVAFEFKTLLDKSSRQLSNDCCDEERLNNEVSELMPSPPYPPPHLNDLTTYDLSSHHPNHSPPSLSTSSASSSSSSSSSSSESAASPVGQSQLIDTTTTTMPPTTAFRTVSPSNIVRQRMASPSHTANRPNITSEDLVVRSPSTNNINMRSRSQVVLTSSSVANIKLDSDYSNNTHHHQHIKIDEFNGAPNKMPLSSTSNNLIEIRDKPPQHHHHQQQQQHITLTNSHFNNVNENEPTSSTSNLASSSSHGNNNNNNITIWREELNNKNNIQQQIKKRSEMSQIIEDSKKIIPEWKKNLIKQKEMKKISINQQNGSNSNISHMPPETPELMKHNIFIKKGLATHM